MRNAGRPFYGIGQFLVCLGNLQVAVAKHRIASRFRLVAGVPSLSSIPLAVVLLTHRSRLTDQLHETVKPNRSLLTVRVALRSGRREGKKASGQVPANG